MTPNDIARRVHAAILLRDIPAFTETLLEMAAEDPATGKALRDAALALLDVQVREVKAEPDAVILVDARDVPDDELDDLAIHLHRVFPGHSVLVSDAGSVVHIGIRRRIISPHSAG